MPNFGLVTRIHVLTAIRTCDKVGASAFAEEYGVEGPAGALVVERGRRYDARPLLAFAYGKATGTPLTGGDIPADAAEVLERLEFKVISPEDVDRPAATRATRTTTPRVAKPRASAPTKPEPVVALCPKCMTQLPANGRCDWCD